MDVLMGIESVLKDEEKSSSYKIALVCSIVDYVIENPSEHPRNGFHYIPLIYIARQFLFYYYPMTWFGEKGIRQGSYPKNKNLAVYSAILKHTNKIKQLDFVYNEPEGIFKIRDNLDVNDSIHLFLLKIMNDLRKIILKQPLTHIKISGKVEKEFEFRDYEVKGKSFVIFGLNHKNLTGIENQDFPLVLKKSISWNINYKKNYSWNQLLDSEPCNIKIGHYTYSALKRYRMFLRDAIIKRWIEFSVENYLENNGNAVYALINSLEMQNVYPKRDPSIIRLLKRHVEKAFSKLICMYCDEVVISYELDHLIPWSKYPVNFFWNLFPACKTCNGQKSDKILTINQQLEIKITSYLTNWFEYFVHLRAEGCKFGGKEFDYSLSNVSISESVKYFIEHLKLISEELI